MIIIYPESHFVSEITFGFDCNGFAGPSRDNPALEENMKKLYNFCFRLFSKITIWRWMNQKQIRKCEKKSDDKTYGPFKKCRCVAESLRHFR